MTIYDFKMKDIHNNIKDFSEYKGMVLLIVNVASKCGNTKQYEQLQQLYDKYKDKKFMVLGFPCNQFFKQEPNDEQQILRFCQSKYNVSFDMFAKVFVNGKQECELYKFLKDSKPWSERKRNVQWNFEKFLIDRNGNVVNRFMPKTQPLEFENEIINLL